MNGKIDLVSGVLNRYHY